jgi:hypothetical protein
MPLSGHMLRDPFGNRACGPEERFRCGLVPLLTEKTVDPIPLAIDGEIGPTSFDFNVRLVRLPTRSEASAPMFPHHLAQHGGPLCFPLPHGLRGKD